ALPAPIRDVSPDRIEHEQVVRGEEKFSSIGCSICHQPNLGNAVGIYSDLLLHDMGYELKDLNFAEPHRIRSERIVNLLPPPSLSFSTYYGNAAGITPRNNRSTDSLSNPSLSPNTNISFNAPTQPKKIQYVTLGRSSETLTEEAGETNSAGTGRTTREVRDMEHQLRIQIEPTNHMQEWRTPPLWGVRDSAPYMHDGRAGTLLEAVSMHEGEAAGTRDRFLNLSHRDRSAIIKFMETLAAPTNVPKAKL
ncbi:MAG: di-heme oxidoredictase family protein, partial [Rubripirellula sp.]